MVLSASDLKNQLLAELTENILPFWMNHAPDQEIGGFYGAVDPNLVVDNEVPRYALLNSRILWSFSAAYRKFGNEDYLSIAHQAFQYLTKVFWDDIHGGVYWSVDKHGRPISDRKHYYAQAFAIYSLSEYLRASQEPQSLKYALDLFSLIEQHGYDSKHGGYIEGSTRDWNDLDDMRLSSKDMNCAKSMNTMLHLLEAFTNLNRVWPDACLSKRLKNLLVAFLDNIFDQRSGHLKLFFDEQWHSLTKQVSFGHDIEASWLLCEAAELLEDPSLIDLSQAAAIKLAEAVLNGGISDTGDYIIENHENDMVNNECIEWWPQVEGMVGFYNAYQITNDHRYLDVVMRLWRFIQSHFIDKERGGWFKNITPQGQPTPGSYKIGPWEGPYHHARACLEIADRLPAA